MKILHVLNTDRYSGAENVVCQIVSLLCEDPEVEMIYCSPDGQIREALLERNITFAPVSKLTASELRRVIREHRPDLIHAHDMRASFIATLACGNIPLISHIHNNSFESRRITVKSVAYVMAAIKARHIFWVSQSSLEDYIFSRIFRKKSSVLYNTIDADALREKAARDLNEYTYDVVYLGRLSYPKNPQRLMHVLKGVAEQCPNMKAAVIGTGELDQEIKQLHKALNLEAQVDLLGFMSNPYKILQCAKVMVMTSRYEGTPMCSLEAMALRTPIVTTPTDGLRDLIQNDYNGYLSNDDNVLAEKVAQIIQNADLYETLANNAEETDRRINDKLQYKLRIRAAYRL